MVANGAEVSSENEVPGYWVEPTLTYPVWLAQSMLVEGILHCVATGFCTAAPGY